MRGAESYLPTVRDVPKDLSVLVMIGEPVDEIPDSIFRPIGSGAAKLPLHSVQETGTRGETKRGDRLHVDAIRLA